ncbi:MAG TPA: TolC family protein [Vicinamibacterales bacterium]
MHKRPVVALRACLAVLVIAACPLSGFGQPSTSAAQQPPAPAPQTPPSAPAPATSPATPQPPAQPAPPAPATDAPPIQEQRGGGPVRKLTIDEAVQLALEQNLDVQVERINPQLQDFVLQEVRSNWLPNVSGMMNYNSTDTPPDNLLAGAQDTLTSTQFFGSAGIDQTLPWGTSYSIGWDASRRTTNNLFANFNPRLFSSLSLSVTQPLLRGLRIDGLRAQYLVQQKNREISDVQLRQQVVNTIRQVRNAYWDLVGARQNLIVAQAALDIARQQLRDNRTRVEVGTMAPIDIVQAEAEVARNEEAAIVAAAQIDQAEDVLRALIFDPSHPDFWTMDLETVDMPALPTETTDVDPEAAVRNALDKRTDLIQLRKQLEAAQINIRYYRNQTLPQVNAIVDYGLQALGGVQVQRGPSENPDNPFEPGPIIGQVERRFGTVLGDLFGLDFPQWTVGVQVSYPLGRSGAEATLARSRLAYTQSELSLRRQELNVAREVRTAARNVNTNRKRVESTRAARVFSERQLEAAQKKFAVGLATSLDVLVAQRDLTTARNAELNAIIDYVKSLVDFEAVQEAGVGGGLAQGATTFGGGGGGGGGSSTGGGTGGGGNQP